MFFVVRSWLGYLAFIGLAFLLSTLGIWCLSQFDNSTRRGVESKSRQGDWGRVHCVVPEWLTEKSFLEEIRYLAGLGFELDLLDPALIGKLTKAFEQHPWVEKVVGIRREKAGVIQVEVVFRVPVLLLSSIGAGSTGKTFRAVDKYGVLLPMDSPTHNLVLFVPDVPSPMTKAGLIFDSMPVIQAASLVGYLVDSVDMKNTLVEFKGDELYLRSVSGDLSCKWGAPIGKEPKGEPVAKVKAQWLTDAFVNLGKKKLAGKTELDFTVHPSK